MIVLRLRETHCRLNHALPQLFIQRWRRSYLHHFLIAPLGRTLTLAKVRDAAMLIADDLHFDMLGLGQKDLDVDVFNTKCRLRLGLTARKNFRQVSRVSDRTSAATTAACQRLDDDASGMLAEECLSLC